MKNYSFIIQEEQNRFILNYGKTSFLENNCENEKKVLAKMQEQINVAHEQVHRLSTNTTSTNWMHCLWSYIAIKSKIKDIDKNKLFMDNLNHINRCLQSGALWKLYLPFYLQDRLVWEKDFLTLNDADCFSLREVQAIVNSAEQYSQIWIDFSNKKMQKQLIRE